MQTALGAKRDDEIASMPLSPEQLTELLDYLDASLESCDHTTKLTKAFLTDAGLDETRVLPWLAEHGGYCDCEVLGNLEDFAEAFREPPIPPKPTPKKQRPSRNLSTLTGWNLTVLPKPWRIANLYAADEPLQMAVGKKGGCTITIIETPMPPGDRTSDDYWRQLWLKHTELPQDAPLRIDHGSLDLPDHLTSTVVQSPRWMPVYCWIVPSSGQWYLEVRTESNRQQGDLSQVATLITQLAANGQ